jgi:hypothetical protein
VLHAIFRARRHGLELQLGRPHRIHRRYRERIEARPPGLAWLDLDYAALIASPEAAVLREAIGFLDLKWDEHVLATAKHGTIGTARIWQARQPLHTRSLGRWREVADFIKPLLKVYGDLPQPAGQSF